MPNAQDMDSLTLGGGDLKCQCKKVTPHAQDMGLFDIRWWGPQVAVQRGHAPRPRYGTL